MLVYRCRNTIRRLYRRDDLCIPETRTRNPLEPKMSLEQSEKCSQILETAQASPVFDFFDYLK